MKKLLCTLLTAVVLASITLSASLVSHADVIDKSNINSGDIIDVVKYDALNDTYSYGTMKIQLEKRNLVCGTQQYLCFIESSFKTVDEKTPAASQKKVKALNDITDETLKKLTADGTASKSNYGIIDSEAYLYSPSVASFTTEKCEEKGITFDKYVWLSIGDKNGNVVKSYLNITEEDKNPTPANTVTIKTVVPRKMSIRLEDGTVLKQDSKFTLPLDKEVKFQMCSNNWDNDTYDDNGNGIAGTVVYKFIVSSTAKKNSFDSQNKTFTICKADKVLRTDVNTCFMAYRFYFDNGNYNKQTGIKAIINTPIESLSVNLPLGSTIKADAYYTNVYQYSNNVFINNNSDMTKSYSDYYWDSNKQLLVNVLKAANTTTNRCSSLTTDGVNVLNNAGINLEKQGIKYWYADTNNAKVYVSMEAYNSKNSEKAYNYYIVYNANEDNFTVEKFSASQNNIPENFLKKDANGPFGTYNEALKVYNTCK